MIIHQAQTITQNPSIFLMYLYGYVAKVELIMISKSDQRQQYYYIFC